MPVGTAIAFESKNYKPKGLSLYEWGEEGIVQMFFWIKNNAWVEECLQNAAPLGRVKY